MARLFRFVILFICAGTMMPALARAELRCAAAIPATLVDTINSQSAYPGERFHFKTTADAVHGGYTIPSGTIGYGYVRYVRVAAVHNRNGLIALEPRVLVIGETHLPVMWDPREAVQYATPETLAEEAFGYAPIPGIASGVINYARVGKPVTIGPGFKFQVIVLDEITTSEPCSPATPTPSPATPAPAPTAPPEVTRKQASPAAPEPTPAPSNTPSS